MWDAIHQHPLVGAHVRRVLLLHILHAGYFDKIPNRK